MTRYILLVACGCLVYAQTLEVKPSHVMADQTAVIRASGLEPGEHVSIQADLDDGLGHRWSSHADFVADEQGVVDLSKLAPVGGSYKEVSAMGLIWSMTPEQKFVPLYMAPKNLGPQIVEFRLKAKGEHAPVARLEQISIAQGMQVIPVRDGKLRGVLFLPASKQPTPGMLVLGGSNGGIAVRQAAWLASHGFAAFALAYFRYQDLPEMLEAIPLEYFGEALDWMMHRPEIVPDRIGVLGTSRGGELALQLGSMYPQISTVVAYVPANVRFPACCGGTRYPYAWTWKGNPLTFVPVRRIHDALASQQAAIQVENTKGPILMISGEDDGVWESSRMAAAVADRLKHAHFPYDVVHLRYAHAGHGAGRPDIAPAWHTASRHVVSGRVVDLGGTAKGDAESSLDSMPKVIEFLQRGLVLRQTQSAR